MTDVDITMQWRDLDPCRILSTPLSSPAFFYVVGCVDLERAKFDYLLHYRTRISATAVQFTNIDLKILMVAIAKVTSVILLRCITYVTYKLTDKFSEMSKSCSLTPNFSQKCIIRSKQPYINARSQTSCVA